MNKINKISCLFLAALLFLASSSVFAQTATDTIPKNWHQLDKATSGYYGISLDKAYDYIHTQKRKTKKGPLAIFSKAKRF
jgi:hypothetical protein